MVKLMSGGVRQCNPGDLRRAGVSLVRDGRHAEKAARVWSARGDSAAADSLARLATHLLREAAEVLAKGGVR